MEREFYQQLKEWKKSITRKPLVLFGARQIGKTYLFEQFGKQEFKQVIYANFEEDLELHSFFERNISPEKIIQSFEIYYGIKIDAPNCLIIFDEIQECGRALTSLKYFFEQKSKSGTDYFVVAAGSLLGLKVGRNSGFPVGKVQLAHLYPLSFFEFLLALGKNQLAEYLVKIKSSLPSLFSEKPKKIDSILLPIHNQLSELFRRNSPYCSFFNLIIHLKYFNRDQKSNQSNFI